MSNTVVLQIRNNSQSTLKYKDSCFAEGGLLDGQVWPEIITKQQPLKVTCGSAPSENAGCLGWVAYTCETLPSPGVLFFSFSNPKGESKNRSGVSTSIDASTADMEPQQLPAQYIFDETTERHYLSVYQSNTQGIVNNVLWNIDDVVTLEPTDGNYPTHNAEVEDVEAIFNNINVDHGYSMYYKIHKQDTNVPHFKGVVASKDKLIFTHTHIKWPHRIDGSGYYFIGNKTQRSKHGARIEAKERIQHDPEWGHPGGIQLCGSYLAMALQKVDNSNHHTEIRIYDSEDTKINKPMTLLNTIKRDRNRDGVKKDGLNGAGMTKEKGKDGHYIVACSTGERLDVYRSDSSGNISAEMTFTQLKPKTRDDRKPVDGIHGGTGIGLMTQTDGSLYFIGMHARDKGPSTLKLFQLFVQPDDGTFYYRHVGDERIVNTHHPTLIDQVDSSDLSTPTDPATDVNTKDSNVGKISFRWGKGLTVMSPTAVKIFATNRDITDQRFLVKSWTNQLGNIAKAIQVSQSYDHHPNTLSIYWMAIEGMHYEVVVRDEYSNPISEIKQITASQTGKAVCEFNTDTEINQSEMGTELIGAVRVVSSEKQLNIPDYNSPYVSASPPFYRLGQAGIGTLSDDYSKSLLEGSWDIPEPGEGAPDVTGYDYQILQTGNQNQVLAQNHEDDASGDISISTDGLDLLGGINYQLIIRATSGDNVVPGEWSEPANFTVHPVYQFPPPSSDIGNAPDNSTGYFIIGDQEAVEGDMVTFYGTNWLSENPLTGGRVDSSLSSFGGYVFVNETKPQGTFQGAFNPQNNANVDIQENQVYSMPVVSGLTKGTDTGLSDHYIAIAGTFKKIVNVQVKSFNNDHSQQNTGIGKVLTVLWESSA